MNEVKCVDCGRTLYDGRSKCDVCGGRMTASAADSYFTPEGRVPKSSYYRQNTSPEETANEPYWQLTGNDSVDNDATQRSERNGSSRNRSSQKTAQGKSEDWKRVKSNLSAVNIPKSRRSSVSQLSSIVFTVVAIIVALTILLPELTEPTQEAYDHIELYDSEITSEYSLQMDAIDFTEDTMVLSLSLDNVTANDMAIQPSDTFGAANFGTELSIQSIEAVWNGGERDVDISEAGDIVLPANSSGAFTIFFDKPSEDWDTIEFKYNILGSIYSEYNSMYFYRE